MEVQKNTQKLRNEFKMEIQSLINSISEMTHTMEGFKDRLDVVEEIVNGIEMREEAKKLRHREKKEFLRMKEY